MGNSIIARKASNYLPLPSFEQLMNLYKSYSYLGKESLPIAATTSLADGVMAKYFGTTRNYAGLSGFWGYIAYNAISNIETSEYISSKYKIPLKLFFALSAIGMVWKGNDFLDKENQDFGKMLRSAAISAKLFESDKKEFTNVEKAFNESTYNGLSKILENFKTILSNKFLLNLLMKQGVNIVKLIVIEKFFSSVMSNSKLSIYYASQEKDGYQKVFKNLVLSAVKFLINTGSTILVTKGLNIDNKISEKVSELVLKESNVNVVMKLGNDVSNLAHDVKIASQKTNSGMIELSHNLIVPYIYANNSPSSENLSSLIKLYPDLILFENVMSSVLTYDNIKALYEYFAGPPQPKTTKTPGVGYTKIATGNTGGPSITMQTNSETYAYQNIQNIAKLGGLQFMFTEVQKYIHGQNSSDNFDTNSIQKLFDFVKTFFNDSIFFVLLPSLNFTSPEDIQKIDNLLYKLNYIIQKSNGEINFYFNNVDTLSRCENTYDALRNPILEGIALRDLAKELILEINDYCLKKISDPEIVSDPCNMIEIEHLKLDPGYIYAISGKIGTGKTTFLSDIANSLNSGIFTSSGTIYYPTINGKKIPMIFCDTEPFSPPDTTLFQKLTYRLPQDYVNNHVTSLTKEILELFSIFGQKSFTEEILSDKEFKGSTGQGKITILIAAIIYKHYLNSPVLFAIDETLANLDRGTFNSVCEVIKSEFNDSIVISVDHNWENSGDFYDRNIDLSFFTPENKELELLGELDQIVLIEE